MQTYFTVRQTYQDEEYKDRDESMWTFKSKAAAYGLVNYIEEHNDTQGNPELYVEEWSIGG